MNKLIELFFISFILSSVIFALLSSCTKLFYKKKTWGRLTLNQLKVVQGDATISQRIELFFQSLFVSVFTMEVYIITIPVFSIFVFLHYL